jgi:hypothetical protein
LESLKSKITSLPKCKPLIKGYRPKCNNINIIYKSTKSRSGHTLARYIATTQIKIAEIKSSEILPIIYYPFTSISGLWGEKQDISLLTVVVRGAPAPPCNPGEPSKLGYWQWRRPSI